MNFKHGCEREGLSNYEHERNMAASTMLLDAIRLHHGIPAAPRPPAKVESPPAPPKKVWFEIVEDRVDPSTGPRIEDIKRAVCGYFDISSVELVSQRRTEKIVRPRQVAYYLAKKLTGRSLPEIGRRIGGRDHTSILAGVRRIEDLRKRDAKIDAAVIEIASKLGGVLG